MGCQVIGQPVKLGGKVRPARPHRRSQTTASAQLIEQGVAQGIVIEQAVQVSAPDPAIAGDGAILDGFPETAVTGHVKQRPGQWPRVVSPMCIS